MTLFQTAKNGMFVIKKGLLSQVVTTHHIKKMQTVFIVIKKETLTNMQIVDQRIKQQDLQKMVSKNV